MNCAQKNWKYLNNAIEQLFKSNNLWPLNLQITPNEPECIYIQLFLQNIDLIYVYIAKLRPAQTCYLLRLINHINSLNCSLPKIIAHAPQSDQVIGYRAYYKHKMDIPAIISNIFRNNRISRVNKIISFINNRKSINIKTDYDKMVSKAAYLGLSTLTSNILSKASAIGLDISNSAIFSAAAGGHNELVFSLIQNNPTGILPAIRGAHLGEHGELANVLIDLLTKTHTKFPIQSTVIIDDVELTLTIQQPCYLPELKSIIITALERKWAFLILRVLDRIEEKKRIELLKEFCSIIKYHHINAIFSEYKIKSENLSLLKIIEYPEEYKTFTGGWDNKNALIKILDYIRGTEIRKLYIQHLLFTTANSIIQSSAMNKLEPRLANDFSAIFIEYLKNYKNSSSLIIPLLKLKEINKIDIVIRSIKYQHNDLALFAIKEGIVNPKRLAQTALLSGEIECFKFLYSYLDTTLFTYACDFGYEAMCSDDNIIKIAHALELIMPNAIHYVIYGAVRAGKYKLFKKLDSIAQKQFQSPVDIQKVVIYAAMSNNNKCLKSIIRDMQNEQEYISSILRGYMYSNQIPRMHNILIKKNPGFEKKTNQEFLYLLKNIIPLSDILLYAALIYETKSIAIMSQEHEADLCKAIKSSLIYYNNDVTVKLLLNHYKNAHRHLVYSIASDEDLKMSIRQTAIERLLFIQDIKLEEVVIGVGMTDNIALLNYIIRSIASTNSKFQADTVTFQLIVYRVSRNVIDLIPQSPESKYTNMLLGYAFIGSIAEIDILIAESRNIEDALNYVALYAAYGMQNQLIEHIMLNYIQNSDINITDSIVSGFLHSNDIEQAQFFIKQYKITEAKVFYIKNIGHEKTWIHSILYIIKHDIIRLAFNDKYKNMCNNILNNFMHSNPQEPMRTFFGNRNLLHYQQMFDIPNIVLKALAEHKNNSDLARWCKLPDDLMFYAMENTYVGDTPFAMFAILIKHNNKKEMLELREGLDSSSDLHLLQYNISRLPSEIHYQIFCFYIKAHPEYYKDIKPSVTCMNSVLDVCYNHQFQQKEWYK